MEAPPSSLVISDFEALRVLGQGGSAEVVLVRHSSNGKLFALKVVSKAALGSARAIQRVEQESVLLKQIVHPYIVRLHYAFEDHSHFYQALDFVGGGDLFSHLQVHGPLATEAARLVLAQMTHAIEHLHREHGIIYRDLKPENVLLGLDGHAVLADFGTAKRLLGSSSFGGSTSISARSQVGTPEYMAPEVLRGASYTFAVDWWAIGVLLYEMLPTGRVLPAQYGAHRWRGTAAGSGAGRAQVFYAVLRAYSALCEEVLQLVERQVWHESGGSLWASSISKFARLKESTAYMRGFLTGVIALPERAVPALPPRAFADLVICASNQKAYQDSLRTSAPPRLLQLMAKGFTIENPELAQAHLRLMTEFDLHAIRTALTVRRCWDLYTEHVDKLQAIEAAVLAELTAAVPSAFAGSAPAGAHHDAPGEPTPITTLTSLPAGWPLSPTVGRRGRCDLTEDCPVDWRISLDDLVLHRRIGGGAMGATYLAAWEGVAVAVKVACSGVAGMAGWRAEVAALTRLR
ncbi:protein kinase 2 [Chrysochromulina tobinii]|uniref:Protein kinase 2 n=1 Tax=Chrysochromulina tobinii TaxID=1460289 RepID=A0A0M0K7C2_9EUKA|nr:protein kinase 2 [Chrysochromulina tobinii]|eukprot:KOO34293.1 protein kinase 2 [Chrysochromulina sp. CCMP291]